MTPHRRLPPLRSHHRPSLRHDLRPRATVLRRLRWDSLHHGGPTNLRRRAGLAHETLLPPALDAQRQRHPRYHHRCERRADGTGCCAERVQCCVERGVDLFDVAAGVVYESGEVYEGQD
jgi:hypothetical protein